MSSLVEMDLVFLKNISQWHRRISYYIVSPFGNIYKGFVRQQNHSMCRYYVKCLGLLSYSSVPRPLSVVLKQLNISKFLKTTRSVLFKFRVEAALSKGNIMYKFQCTQGGLWGRGQNCHKFSKIFFFTSAHVEEKLNA